MEDLKSILANNPEASTPQTDEASLTTNTEACDEKIKSISSTIGELTETPTSENLDNQIMKTSIKDDNTQ